MSCPLPVELLTPSVSSVWVKRGICSADSIINLALCCLGFLPGLLHTWYIIYAYPDPSSYETVPQDAHEGRVTYYYVAQGPPPTRRPHQQYQSHPPPQRKTYGTVAGSQPDAGQFPGQQSGVMPFGAPPKGQPVPQGPVEGEGSGAAPPPPSYQDAIKGDNKVQTQE